MTFDTRSAIIGLVARQIRRTLIDIAVINMVSVPATLPYPFVCTFHAALCARTARRDPGSHRAARLWSGHDELLSMVPGPLAVV